MFDTLKNLLTDMTPALKGVINGALYVVAVCFAGKPGIHAMRNFGDAKWAEGLKYMGAVVLIFVIPVVTTVLLLTMGTKTGNDLNQKANMISALIPVVGIYLVTKFPKEDQLG
ncbi:hypothetical protein [Enterococcus faecium]|uniref:hypothetical protein n=1 Tax=Enterococcus faecium TaxID=1352 RepID=UPI000813D727|nr:hypothetical protein [Enterococcus faecium]